MYVLPKNQANVRRVMRTSKVFARAVGIWSKVKKVKQIRQRGFLPNVSLRGARRIGPIPNTTTNPVWQPITSFSRAFKDSAICQIPGAKMLLGDGLRTTQLLPRPEIYDLLNMLAIIAMFTSFFHSSKNGD